MKLRIFLIIGIFLAIMPHSIALEYPKPVGYVNDYAGILTPDQILKLDNELKDFDNKTTIEIAVVTVQSLGGLNIETYTMGLMNKWGVGKKGKDNGVMLLVALNERKVRIGTGSGMGQILSDSDANNIIQNDIIPYFKKGDMSGGIISGTESIIHHLSSQSGVVETISQANSQPPLSDNDIKNGILFISGIIGTLIILITGNWIWNKNKIKKQNISLFKKLKNDTYNTLLENYQNAELTLAILEQNNPTTVWSDIKDEYNSIDFTYIGKELDIIQKGCNKIFSSSKVNTKINYLEDKIDKYINICQKIEARKNEVIQAKEKSNLLYNQLPQIIDKIKELLKHQDVSAKTKGMIDSVENNYINIKIGNNNNIDWLQTFSKLNNISEDLDNIKDNAEKDIDSATDARIRGPELLRNLPDLIEKFEKKLSSSGSKKARTLFADAKDKYDEAKRISTSGSDLLDAYFLAIMADSLLDQAESSHRRHSSESSSSQTSHESSSHSSGFGGFGGFGGGGSSGGGATGGW